MITNSTRVLFVYFQVRGSETDSTLTFNWHKWQAIDSLDFLKIMQIDIP